MRKYYCKGIRNIKNKITTEYYIIYITDIFKRNYKILIKCFVVAPSFKLQTFSPPSLLLLVQLKVLRSIK